MVNQDSLRPLIDNRQMKHKINASYFLFVEITKLQLHRLQILVMVFFYPHGCCTFLARSAKIGFDILRKYFYGHFKFALKVQLKKAFVKASNPKNESSNFSITPEDSVR